MVRPPLHEHDKPVEGDAERAAELEDLIRAQPAKNSGIHFCYTPSRASWLNQVEGFFGIFAKQ